MYKGYLAFVILFVHLNGSILNNVDCNYVYSHNGYIKPEEYSNYKGEIANFCTQEAIPKDVNFTLILNENNTVAPSDILRINFKPPKANCKYGISLLANASIQNERECMVYNFQDSTNMEAQTHTAEKTICVNLSDDFLSMQSDSSTVTVYQGNITLWFQFIFTGCYAIKYRLDKNKIVVQRNTFLRTDYQLTQVDEPTFQCTYDEIHYIHSSQKVIIFMVDISMLADTGVLLTLGLWSDFNERKICRWNNESGLYAWSINVWEQNSVIDQRNCTRSQVQMQNKRYIRMECNFEISTPESGNYCFVIRLIDERCKKHTLWNPPMIGNVPCTWMKRCTKVIGKNLHHEHTEEQTYTWMDVNSYMLLPILIITSTMVMMLVVMYLTYHIRNCKVHDEKCYIYTPESNSTSIVHSRCNAFSVSDVQTHNKEMQYEDMIVIRDIVLLYPKSSATFMAFMADFRGSLARICQCSVHDWYDSTEWNYVSEIGGPDWFLEMLHKGSNVVWVDTPTMRSLITCKFKKDISEKCDKPSSIDIGDFRDVVFPVIFNLAKRNTQDFNLQHQKHYIVRLKGFEEFGDLDDPFIDLSTDRRYSIPQDLHQLCSHLTMSGLNVSKRYVQQEKDLINQQLSHII